MYPAERVLGHSRGHPSTEDQCSPLAQLCRQQHFTSAGQLHRCFSCNHCASRAPAALISSHTVGLCGMGQCHAETPALNGLPCLPGAFISCWCNTWPFWETTHSCSRCSVLTSLFPLYSCTTLDIFCWAIETNACTIFSQAILYGPLLGTVKDIKVKEVRSPADINEKSLIFSISDTFCLLIFCPIFF